jgi:hypothetical protein
MLELADSEKLMVPLPVPEVLPVNVIHEEAVEALHEQVDGAVTVMELAFSASVAQFVAYEAVMELALFAVRVRSE